MQGSRTQSRVLGPYEVLDTIGHGGMGVVYRGCRAGSKHVVALKTVGAPAPLSLDGIRREIHALTRIRHPGVVRLLEHGVHDGLPWYAMEFLDGQSLRRFGEMLWGRYLPRPLPALPADAGAGPTTTATQTAPGGHDAPQIALEIAGLKSAVPLGELPLAAAGELRRVVGITLRLCQTLAFLHGEGFVDCDLTPDNVVLVGDVPIIIDLGLTALHPGESGREPTVAGAPGQAGTVPYMSPEQIRREFVDARSDLYAVGCMLYELISGKPPFVGAARLVRLQHLYTPPPPLSAAVQGLPPRFEALISNLLEKDLLHRIGFADEVARELAAVAGDAPPPAYPGARPYLYRARFVGREGIIAELTGIRDRAAGGRGALVLLGGESGVGKTRIAMELSRGAAASGMRVVAAEAPPLTMGSDATVGAPPLSAMRSLLQAVADHCHQGGAPTTARLLGHRISVLAAYEPSLWQLPGAGAPQMPVALNAEASRRRLFTYLADVLAAFAREQPLVWILDDLGWVDELTHSFLQSLTAELLASMPILILGSYRAEEPSEAIAALTKLAHVTAKNLPRLDAEAVRVIVGDMLAMRDPPERFVAFLARQAEGNPLFVAEYLRAAVTERILYRNRDSAWRVLDRGDDASADYSSLALPRSLRDLLEHHLRALSPAARELATVAAVLGREVDLAVAREVAALPDDVGEAALVELVQRVVLEDAGNGAVRFAHDKLREVTYGSASANQLVATHGRAATALERRLAESAEPNRHWAILGHHFAAAKRPAPAARYLRMAADHARATFANGEAIRLYRDAITHARHVLLDLPDDATAWQAEIVAQQEILGDILTLTSKREEARAAYDEALTGTPAEDHAWRARLLRKLGKTWELQHEHAEALRHYERACSHATAGAEARGEWIQAQIEQLWVHYWLNDVDRMDALIAALRPSIEEQGTAVQRATFFQLRTLFNFRRDRYLVSEETLRFAKAAADACDTGGETLDLLPRFTYGHALLFHRSLDAAEAELHAVRAAGRRVGDTALEARCLTYLALGARMRGRVSDVATYTKEAAAVADATNMVEYIAAAQANQAWLALKAGDGQSAGALARAALEGWAQRVFPFQWMALLPLLEVELGRGNLDAAMACVRGLFARTQQFLPGGAADAFARGLRSWAAEDMEAARAALVSGLAQLEGTGYR